MFRSKEGKLIKQTSFKKKKKMLKFVTLFQRVKYFDTFRQHPK